MPPVLIIDPMYVRTENAYQLGAQAGKDTFKILLRWRDNKNHMLDVVLEYEVVKVIGIVWQICVLDEAI